MPRGGMYTWPQAFLWHTTTDQCCLGLIGRRLTNNLLAKGVVCQKFRKNYFFSEICAIVPSTRQFGYKKKGAFRVHTREEVPKTIF